jgi:hypothetical protein
MKMAFALPWSEMHLYRWNDKNEIDRERLGDNNN